jgi:hypothetical protein
MEASLTFALHSISPQAFCRQMLAQLGAYREEEPWVRGVRSVCEMYATTDPWRFHVILTQLARGSAGSALAEGARWLLPRWTAATRR